MGREGGSSFFSWMIMYCYFSRGFVLSLSHCFIRGGLHGGGSFRVVGFVSCRRG